MQAIEVGSEPGTVPRAGFDRDLFGCVAQIIGVDIGWVEVARNDALAGLAEPT